MLRQDLCIYRHLNMADSSIEEMCRRFLQCIPCYTCIYSLFQKCPNTPRHYNQFLYMAEYVHNSYQYNAECRNTHLQHQCLYRSRHFDILWCSMVSDVHSRNQQTLQCIGRGSSNQPRYIGHHSNMADWHMVQECHISSQKRLEGMYRSNHQRSWCTTHRSYKAYSSKHPTFSGSLYLYKEIRETIITYWTVIKLTSDYRKKTIGSFSTIVDFFCLAYSAMEIKKGTKLSSTIFNWVGCI